MAPARFILVLAVMVGCAPRPEIASRPEVASPPATSPRDTPAGAPFGAPVSLALDRAELRAAGATPQMLSRLDASVHRYFRAIAVEYSSRTCFEFRDLRWRLPVVAVHGDPHVEQFVVTPTTFKSAGKAAQRAP